MWSEENNNIDNRIREAADSMHTQVADKHWENMEALLDEHLPVEKKKRRFLFILLLTGLFTGAGIITTIQLTKKDGIITNQERTPQQGINNNSKKPIEGNSTPKTQSKEQRENITAPNTNEKEVKDINASEPSESVQLKNKQSPQIISTNTGNKKSSYSRLIKKQTKPALPKLSDDDEINSINSNSYTKNDEKEPATNKIYLLEKKDSTLLQNNITPITETTTSAADNKETDSSAITDKNQEEKTTFSKNKLNKFSILLSAGTDISGIGTNPGTAQIAYGIGVAYTFNEKWTLRAGFLAALKKYDAKPDQYHPDNYGFWNYYQNMQKINADCFVYEIPVSVMYSFKTNKNHNWFVSAGLSSLIMRRETYDYTYKDNLGQTRYSTHTYENEYKHLFSVVNISGGYQYRFNQKFSLLAEPYIKMPLAGVGFGHVKLNSAGILVTAAIKPFHKSNK